MKKIKLLGIIVILSLSLVSCSGLNKSKNDEEAVKQEEAEGMSEKDKEHFEELLDDVADTEVDRVENEMELVSLAEEWIAELAQMPIDVNEVKSITSSYLDAAEIRETLRFKEVFPKLNDYAIGLINNDSNTLGLLEGAGKELSENIVSEGEWIQVYEIVLAEVEK